MTPDVQAAANRVHAFLAAWDEHHTTRDQVLVQVKPGSADMLTSDDLRALLGAVDPAEEESIEWATLQRWPSDGREQIVGPAPESHARYRLAQFPMHVALMHRQVRYGPWIEGEPAAAEDTKGPEQ